MTEQELDLDLKARHCYRFETEKQEVAIYKWAKENQYTPLVFSRVVPDDVVEQYEIKENKIVWLSEGTVKGVDVIKPSDLAGLTTRVTQADGKALVHFGTGALSYLVSNNNYSHILRAMQYLADKVGASERVLAVHLNPDSFDGKEYSNLCETVPLLPLEWKEPEEKA